MKNDYVFWICWQAVLRYTQESPILGLKLDDSNGFVTESHEKGEDSFIYPSIKRLEYGRRV